jgi:hypothetical protein
MTDWREKDDLNLTAEDITTMLDAGDPIPVTGPRLPGSAVIVTAFPTLGSGSVPVGESLLLVGGSVRVSQPLST